MKMSYDELVSLANGSHPCEKQYAAMYDGIPASILLQIAECPAECVRIIVARHPALTIDMVKDNMQVFYDFKLEWFDRHPNPDFAYQAKEFIKAHRHQVC